MNENLNAFLSYLDDDDDEESSGSFLKYFLLISASLVIGYLAYHNKSKVSFYLY
jgi:hypothetical protein